MMAENSPNQVLPNTVVALAPEPIAPTVWAIVFNVRMAAKRLVHVLLLQASH